MRFGRGRWHWYDLPILALAAAIVYPDRVLDWIGERTGKAFGWTHVVLVEVFAVALLFGLMTWLIPRYESLTWWKPLLFIGVLGLFRALMWCVTEFFGFDD
ncbi:MAG TPA: hypothetical protein VK530_11240 [Candidatus Acidoferrum sp.]|nr:hypothetical protein [Candidatus Acidoferrum sp.]